MYQSNIKYKYTSNSTSLIPWNRHTQRYILGASIGRIAEFPFRD